MKIIHDFENSVYIIELYTHVDALCTRIGIKFIYIDMYALITEHVQSIRKKKKGSAILESVYDNKLCYMRIDDRRCGFVNLWWYF